MSRERRERSRAHVVDFNEEEGVLYQLFHNLSTMGNELPPSTLNLHTNSHAILDRPTLEDVNERIFRCGSFQGLFSTDSMSSKVSKFKRVLTSSCQIVEDQNITNDNTNDNVKTNYSTEMKLSQDEGSLKVVNVQEYKLEQNKTSAILENIFNLQFYVSLVNANKISKLFMICALLSIIISLLYLLNSKFSGILCNMISFYTMFTIVIFVLFLYMYMYYIIILQQSIDNVITTLEDDCNLFEKAVLLSTDVNTTNKSSLSKQCLRSRYANFYIAPQCVIYKLRSVQHRDREPSRIPVKQLTRVMNKSRTIRKLVRQYIARNVPMSSRIHCYINKCGFTHSAHCKYVKRTRKMRFSKRNKVKNKIHNAERHNSKYHGNKSSSITLFKIFIYKHFSSTYQSLKQPFHV